MYMAVTCVHYVSVSAFSCSNSFPISIVDAGSLCHHNYSPTQWLLASMSLGKEVRETVRVVPLSNAVSHAVSAPFVDHKRAISTNQSSFLSRMTALQSFH